ncbi:MAG: N-acetylmuramoyl-L-alanine amidase [Actinomycetota bacterium]
MPSPRRTLARVLVVLVMGGLALGTLPPVVAGGPPPTVLRTARLDVAGLLPAQARASLLPRGGVRAEQPTWTRAVVRCASIRFTMVGVTWRQSGDAVVPVRLAWGPRGGLDSTKVLRADPDEGPDPGSRDDAGISGTMPLWTGEADCLRLRVRLPAGERLSDLRIAFLNSSGTAEDPSPLALIGNAMARMWGMVVSAEPASALTTKPAIITRKQWGADESLRTKNCSGEPSYAKKLKMAHVHHTAGSNAYTKAEADDVIRGIYSYHVNSRGFCDIAYNFLIDKYGRTYEGRYGGMSKPVIGGHAMGFNTGSTGIAAMGDFTTKKVPWKMLKAYKQLLAWRLDVAHLKPTGWTTMVSGGGSNTPHKAGEKVKLKVISGHRDTGYTSCPGDKLYAKLPAIRKAAKNIGRPKIWNPKEKPKELVAGQDEVRWTAKLSGTLDWSIQVKDDADVVVRTFTGTGSKIDKTWKGTNAAGLPVPAGDYKVFIEAQNAKGKVARSKKFNLTVTAPLP